MPKKEVKQDTGKYLFWGIVAILVFLSYTIIKSFIIPLISAFILAYLTKPVYNFLKRGMGKTFSAILCVLLVIIIIILPLGALVGGITQQAYSFLNQNTLSAILEKFSSLPVVKNINIDFNSLVEKGLTLVISLLSSAISYLPSLIITLIITLFGIFYMLIFWESLSIELKKYIPFKNKQKISEEIASATRAIVYGAVLIALIEFVVAFIGFFISGASFYLLLPLIIFLFAFIPGLGPTLVWAPLAIYYFFVKDYGTMAGVVITGIILSLGIDTILRSKLLGKKAKINPLIMLIGVIGGISVFGIFGFIIGPLILVYTIKLIQQGLEKD